MDWHVAALSSSTGQLACKFIGFYAAQGTYAKVASASPSMTICGLAPRVASHKSLTKEPHTPIISFGEHARSTTPKWVPSLSPLARSREIAMCCSAMRRTAMRLRMVLSRNSLICSGVRYLEHSWNLISGQSSIGIHTQARTLSP